MIGSVVSWAARVKSTYAPTGPATLRAVSDGRRRASSPVNQSWNGPAYRIMPRVAAKDSWKPTSQSTFGLMTAITPPVKASVLRPFWRRPICRAKIASPPMMAARTTEAVAPTSTV